MLLYASAWYVNDGLFKSKMKICFERWRSGYDLVLSESSLSFQFPSSAQIAVILLVCALRCLYSRSLACVTSFPLPGQSMLIITSVFQTPLFSGGIFKNFQIHIPTGQSDWADGFSNNRYSRQERKERQNICRRVPIVYLAGYWDDLTTAIFRTVTEVSGTVFVGVRHQSSWD